MKRSLAFLSVTLVPAVAAACPGYAQQTSCCGSAFSHDVAALSFGVLIGVASIAVESVVRRRR
jgi:hypothetical protein